MAMLRSALSLSASVVALLCTAEAAKAAVREFQGVDLPYSQLSPAAGTTEETIDAAAAPAAPPPEAAPQAEPTPQAAPEAKTETPATLLDANPGRAVQEAKPAGEKPADTLDAAPALAVAEPEVKPVQPESEKAYDLPVDVSTERQLTLEEVIELAIKNSPDRAIADAQINQAESAVEEARSNYFPQAFVKAEAGWEYNDPFAVRQGATQYAADNKANSTTGNVRQMLYDGYITRETVRQRMQQVESTKISRNKVLEELIRTTTEVYMEYFQFQQVSVASKENLEALQEIARLVDLRVEAGDASKAEQNYVKARVAAAQQNNINAQAGLRDSFAALTYLTGEIGEFAAVQPPMEAYGLPGPQEIVERAMAASTDIRLVQSDHVAALHELQAAKGKYLPELAVVLDGNHAEDVGGQTGIRDFASAKLQVSYKLLDGGLRKATTEKQYAKVREIQNRIMRTRRDLTQKVTRDLNRQQTAQRELKVTEDEIAANTELEQLYRKQFSQGDIDITNLVESQERIFSGRMKRAKLQSDIVNSTFALLRSGAELLPRFCGSATGC